MDRIRTALSRVAEIVLRGRRERRLASEIEHHIELLADDLKRTGLSDADALIAARRQFGGIDQLHVAHREQRGFPTLDSFTQDIKFAVRVLVRDRGFALTAILVLGLGLGVNNMFFTLFYAHKVRGVPVEDVDRVLSVSTFDDRGNDRPLSLPEFDELLQVQSSFSTMGAYVPGVTTIGDEGRAPDRFDAAYVTASTFATLRLAPVMGRLPEPAGDRPGGHPVVVLGTDVWRSRYASDPQVLGRTIFVNGSRATVVAIIRERSGFPTTASVWLPLGQLPDWKEDRTYRPLRVVGRLRDEVSADAATTEIETVFGRFESAYPETNQKVRARIVSLNVRVLGSLEGWMQFVYAGIIVILVACANVANLMIARAAHRAQEIAIRTSLGASRRRVVAQLLTEAAIIACGGAVIGAVVSIAGVRLLQTGIPAGILPYWLDYTMDRTVFLTLVGVAMMTVVVFGLLPALQASRTDVNRTLKDGGRSATAASSLRIWTSGFLTVQLALAMILMAQLALVALLADDSIPTDDNINTTEVMTAAITLPAVTYPDAARRAAFFARLDERLAARPEITAYTRATILPGDGAGTLRALQIRGHEPTAGDSEPRVLTIEVAPAYFATLALQVLRGRDFTPGDGMQGTPVAVVNERFAEVFLSNADPLNVEISVAPASAGNTPAWRAIVGIAPTVRQQGAGGAEQQTPVVYLPLTESTPATSTLMVRHRVDPETVAAALRAEAQQVDANVPLYRMRTLEQAVYDAQWNRRISVVLADTVTFLSVLLAIVGLYAVTAQRVTLKNKEIGLRMALGARPLHVARVIIAGLRMPLLFGLLLGTAGAMAWDDAYSSGIAGVYASAPPTLLKIAALIVAVVLVSCFIPVRRAIGTSPIAALRQD